MDVFADSENSASPAKVAAAAAAAAGLAPQTSPGNAGGAAEGDDDMAFARLVAEQERAFYLMRGGNGAELREPGAAAGGFDSPDARGAAQPAQDGAAEEEDPDVAFARALMEEEAREWNARMLAMAGLPAPGAAAAAELEAMGVEEAYEEEDAVDVDAMTYEELLALGDAAGHVSRGCSAALIAALPSSEYSAAAHAAAGGAEQCAVCRLEYEVGDVTTTLPCKHYFHAECLAPWLRANKTCICCKRELPGASPAHAARRAAV